jgi:hypothetical protein
VGPSYRTKLCLLAGSVEQASEITGIAGHNRIAVFDKEDQRGVDNIACSRPRKQKTARTSGGRTQRVLQKPLERPGQPHLAGRVAPGLSDASRRGQHFDSRLGRGGEYRANLVLATT